MPTSDGPDGPYGGSPYNPENPNPQGYPNPKPESQYRPAPARKPMLGPGCSGCLAALLVAGPAVGFVVMVPLLIFAPEFAVRAVGGAGQLTSALLFDAAGFAVAMWLLFFRNRRR